MRILERNDWEPEVTCRMCKSRMAINESDVKRGNFGGYGGDNDFRYYCECGVCHQTITLTDSSIPSRVKESCRDTTSGRGINL